MSYLLNSTQIKAPNGFREEIIEQSVQQQTISGEIKKQITSRQKRYVLRYENISRDDFNTIKAIWDLKSPVTFKSTETNNAIPETSVHVEIKEIEYRARGNEYRPTFTLVLTEVG